MAVVRPLVLLCSIGAVFAPTAHAQETLTLTDVLARARDRSPQVIAARRAVDEARARLIGAGLRPRWMARRRSIDL